MSRGFTMVEILVAGAVAVTLLVLAGGALFTGSRSSTRGIEKLDEIGRLARLGEYLKKPLRFATRVERDQPDADRVEYRVRYVEEISPVDGSRVEKQASFTLLGAAPGPRKVEIDLAGRKQVMEFDRLDMQVGITGNLIDVVLDGGGGRVIQVSVASPYMIALSGGALDQLSGGDRPVPEAGPGPAPQNPALPQAGDGTVPAGEVFGEGPLGPGFQGGGAIAQTSPATGPGGAVVASRGAPPPAGPSGKDASSLVKPPLPARRTPEAMGPTAGFTGDKGPPEDEPAVEAIDPGNTPVAGPPRVFGQGRPPVVIKPTVKPPGTIDPPPPIAASAAGPDDEPQRPPAGVKGRRPAPPMNPKDRENLRRLLPRDGQEAPDPETLKRERPPRGSQTIEPAEGTGAGMDAPF